MCKGGEPDKYEPPAMQYIPTRLNDGGLTARRAFDLAGGETACAHLDLDHRSGFERPDDLQVGLPGAAGFVIRVRHRVSEGDAFVTGVAAIALNGHVRVPQLRINSIRAISAPSPLRWPVLRMRV